MHKAVLTAICVTISLAATRAVEAQQPADRSDAATHHVVTQHRHALEHTPLSVGLDTVTGFGDATFIAPADTESADAIAAEAGIKTAEVVTGSIIVGGAYELTEHLGVGARVPIVLGQWQDRSESVLGNVELEAEYGIPLNDNAYLRFGLGLALPVAQGREVPEAEAVPTEMDAATLRAYDRGALLKAAVASRGLEDEALFEVDHLGIVPKLSLDVHYKRLLLGPFTRVENLLDTRGSEGESMFEWLVGSYGGVEVSRYVDIGARAFADIVLAGPSSPAFVVEPQLTAHLGQLRAVLGGIWPALGSASLRQFVGVRALISMRI